jgi:hypothetical protein
VVKVRDAQVRNKHNYVVIGVTANGERDLLGHMRALAALEPRRRRLLLGSPGVDVIESGRFVEPEAGSG